MEIVENKGTQKKRSQNAGTKFIKAKKKLDEVLQALGDEPDFVPDLKAMRDRLLDRFVEEERKAGS